MEVKKVKKVGTISKNIKNSVEEMTYGTSMFLALSAMSFCAFDFAVSGTFNNLTTHPIEYGSIILSPVVIGGLIKTFDPNSETSQDINHMINDFKPKIRKR